MVRIFPNAESCLRLARALIDDYQETMTHNLQVFTYTSHTQLFPGPISGALLCSFLSACEKIIDDWQHEDGQDAGNE